MLENKVQIFDNQPIRTAWNEENEEWYFSIVDVVRVLTEQKDVRHASTYWSVIKKRLKEEGASQLLTNCKQLKMKAADGKNRLTDVANTEELLRIIQSIPSKKAEPFKMWLAEIGRDRIEEIIDPELTIDRALETQLNTRQHENLKGLKKENLRDNMNTLELALNMLAEATTTEITKATNPQGLEQNKTVAKTGGRIAGNARKSIEEETGKSVVTSANAEQLDKLVTGAIEEISKAKQSTCF